MQINTVHINGFYEYDSEICLNVYTIFNATFVYKIEVNNFNPNEICVYYGTSSTHTSPSDIKIFTAFVGDIIPEDSLIIDIINNQIYGYVTNLSEEDKEKVKMNYMIQKIINKI